MNISEEVFFVESILLTLSGCFDKENIFVSKAAKSNPAVKREKIRDVKSGTIGSGVEYNTQPHTLRRGRNNG